MSAPPLVLIDGDADEVIGVLRAGARTRGAVLLDRGPPPSGTGAGAGAAGAAASVVIIAVQQRSGASGLAKIEEVLDRIAENAVVVVIIVQGAARIAPQRLSDLLGREVLYQLRAAVAAPGSGRIWRTARLRTGLVALGGLGIRVFRVDAAAA